MNKYINSSYIDSLSDDNEIKIYFNNKKNEIEKYIETNEKIADELEKNVRIRVSQLSIDQLKVWSKNKKYFPNTLERIEKGTELYIELVNQCIKNKILPKTCLCKNLRTDSTCKWMNVTLRESLNITKSLNKIRKRLRDCHNCHNGKSFLHIVHDNLKDNTEQDKGICPHCNQAVTYVYVCKHCRNNVTIV